MRRAIPLLYSLATLLSAALLFTTQLSFSKALLPLLGGAPTVWITAMLFFQTVLLAGYGYAHVLARALPPAHQARVHLGLLALSVLALPVGGLRSPGPPAVDAPVVWLLTTLAMTVGPIALLLSATSPLLQTWFGESTHARAYDPYFLYAPSNVGSMLAVLGYPLVVEPLLSLRTQHRALAAGYVVLVVVIGMCATVVWRTRLSRLRDPASGGREPSPPPDLRAKAWWVALAMVPASLTLGATLYLTTDVASVPLLWVAPLSLYLLSFVLTFGRATPIPRVAIWWLQLLVIGFWLATQIAAPGLPVWSRFAIHLLLVFSTAMACHGELAHRRPGAGHLTTFYLWIAAGGALGALFNAVLAPALFRTVLEYPLAILAACLVRPRLHAGNPSRIRLGVEWTIGVTLAALAFAILYWPPIGDAVINAELVVAVLVLDVVVLLGRRSALVLGALVAAGWFASTAGYRGDGLVLAERTFFGVYSVRESRSGAVRAFYHGTTKHGIQWARPAEWRKTPTSYFAREGPLGQLMESRDGFSDSARVAVVGLGVGTVACYAKPGQRWTFFEIDPVVAQIARNPAYFTFLSECAPNATIVLGDGRLALGAQPDSTYDLLILDAFTSDALPVHLITREALEMYLRKLTASGVIAIDISNRYLDLEAVLAALARDADLVALHQNFVPAGTVVAERSLIDSSRWIVLAADSAAVSGLLRDSRWAPPADAGGKLWTDGMSSIAGILRWSARSATR